jgi:hypothetical protein
MLVCAIALTGRGDVVHPHILCVSRPIYFFLPQIEYVTASLLVWDRAWSDFILETEVK